MAKTIFEDGNILTRIPGTRVLAAWLNKVFSHRHDGLDQDGSAPLDYAEDTGTVNNLVVALTPPLLAPVVGLPIWIRVAHENTGTVLLTVDGLEAFPIIRNAGAGLLAGDIKEGQVIGVIYTGAAYQLANYQNPPVTDADTLNSQTAAMLCPPGAIMPFATQTTPPGWLPCDGREVLRGTYATLFATIGTAWGDGDTVTTFNVPDFRGEFIRGWDDGRGVDADRQFASYQADALQNITGTHVVSHTVAATGTGAFLEDGAEGTHTFDSQSAAGVRMSFDASRVARTADETRPRNIAVKYCIKY